MPSIYRYSIMILAIFATYIGKAQDVPEKYITEGLLSNLVLQQKNVGLQKSLVALKIAKSMFLPTSWLEGQYTLAEGGRTLDIPAGDLINPIYKTLNQLTGNNNFPVIQNVSESFLPNDFYDLRLKTTLPIINSDLKFNRKITEQETLLQQTQIDIYKRELVRDMKVGYYQFLETSMAIKIYQNALQVVSQNLRANQSLLKNGKGLPAYVAKAESEVQQVSSDLENAYNDYQNAKAYFNFLLNRPLNDSIESSGLDGGTAPSLPTEQPEIEKREELKGLDIAAKINSLSYQMSKAYKTPHLNAFLDLGAQDFQFRVESKSFFYLSGLQLDIPIFTGKRNLYKIDLALLNENKVSIQKEATEKQLELTAFVSRNKVFNAWNSYQSSIKQEVSAQKYFMLVDLGYRQGVNSFLEFLDARKTFTSARLMTNINHFKVLIALADYERQTSSFNFK